MFLAALRGDNEDYGQVTDIDPIGMAYDLSTGSPPSTGICIFHGKYNGRTEPTYASTATPVKVLRGKTKTEELSFDDASERFANTMNYVATEIRDT